MTDKRKKEQNVLGNMSECARVRVCMRDYTAKVTFLFFVSLSLNLVCSFVAFVAPGNVQLRCGV